MLVPRCLRRPPQISSASSCATLLTFLPKETSGEDDGKGVPRRGLGAVNLRRGMAFVVLTLLAVSSTAFAGPIRARVVGIDKLVPEVYAEIRDKKVGRFFWREPSATVRPEFRNLSPNPTRDICVAALGAAPGTPREPVVVKVTGGRTYLTNLVVAPGTKVVFENRDPFEHRLTLAGSTPWQQSLKPSGRHEWTAPQGQGRYEFRDDLAPSLRFYVMVEPNVVEVAYPGRDGWFAMNLPAGEFTLQAFFNGKKIGRPLQVNGNNKILTEIKEPMHLAEGESK